MDWAKYQERITIEDKDGKSFMEFIDVIGPIQIKQQMKERNMRQLGEEKKEKCRSVPEFIGVRTGRRQV